MLDGDDVATANGVPGVAVTLNPAPELVLDRLQGLTDAYGRFSSQIVLVDRVGVYSIDVQASQGDWRAGRLEVQSGVGERLSLRVLQAGVPVPTQRRRRGTSTSSPSEPGPDSPRIWSSSWSMNKAEGFPISGSLWNACPERKPTAPFGVLMASATPRGSFGWGERPLWLGLGSLAAVSNPTRRHPSHGPGPGGADRRAARR